MTAKHTPGPWGYQDPMAPQILSIVTNPEGEAYEWEHIAQIGTAKEDGDDRSYEEHEANARLIAAAPDMLAALREVSDRAQPEGPLPPFPDRYELMVRRVRAAIAKAEGRL